MGKADFGAVDETIAEGFEEGEGRVVVGVEEDVLFDLGLHMLVVQLREKGGVGVV